MQIKELRSDGFLWDLARKEKLGARIRNAQVVGSLNDYRTDVEALRYGDSFKLEDDDVDIFQDVPPRATIPEGRLLPPQVLLLQLHTGDSVFLMLRQSTDGVWKLVITSRYRVMKPMLGTQPGMYLEVDPTSRYMAVGCSEAHFTIYELGSRKELQQQYSGDLELQHVKAASYIPVPGVIQNLSFLYPSQGLVVLLALVLDRGKPKMFVYEWAEGSDVQRIKSLNRGHLLPDEHWTPLLVIPLRFKSAFVLVSEHRMSIFQDILEGAPNPLPFHKRLEKPTVHHHGRGNPLWVAWSRPPRVGKYHEENDNVYITREDGLLMYLKVDSDLDDIEHNGVGVFDGRCGSTLASMSYDSPHLVGGDLLITNGDSCPGGCYYVSSVGKTFWVCMVLTYE